MRVAIYFLLYVFCVCASAVASAAPEKILPSAQIVDCAAAPERFDVPARPDTDPKHQESACLEKLKGFVSRSGNILKIRTDVGVTTFKDNEDDCSSEPCSNYKMIGYRPDNRLYIVSRSFSEKQVDIVIRVEDAFSIQLAAPIRFSRDGDLILSIADGVSLMPFDYDIKIIRAAYFEVVFTYYNQEVWQFVSWPKDDEIDIETVQGNVETKPYAAKLLFFSQSWHLEAKAK